MAGVFEDRAAVPFLGSLPAVLHVRAGVGGGWLELAQLLIARELDEGRSAASAIVGRLADALFIEAVRTYFENHHGTAGWTRALQDPPLANALAAIHDDPAHPWTVGELAAHVGVSRSVFARRFAAALGESPIRYLARARLGRATHLLRGGTTSIARVAEQVCYESEAAFGRAFRRHVGVTPAAFRREATGRHAAATASR